MTAPPAVERDSTGMPAGQVGPSMGDLCPDAEALIAAARAEGRYLSPSRAQDLVSRYLANLDLEADGGHALVMTRGTSGSVPVDAQMEREAPSLRRAA